MQQYLSSFMRKMWNKLASVYAGVTILAYNCPMTKKWDSRSNAKYFEINCKKNEIKCARRSSKSGPVVQFPKVSEERL